MVASKPPLRRLARAWRSFLKSRAGALEGSPKRIRLDRIYVQTRPILEQLTRAAMAENGRLTDGEMWLLSGRALDLLKEFDPKPTPGNREIY